MASVARGGGLLIQYPMTVFSCLFATNLAPAFVLPDRALRENEIVRPFLIDASDVKTLILNIIDVL